MKLSRHDAVILFPGTKISITNPNYDNKKPETYDNINVVLEEQMIVFLADDTEVSISK